MIAEDGPITQLVHQTQVQVRQVCAMFNRVSESLNALQGAGEENAEGGWRRY